MLIHLSAPSTNRHIQEPGMRKMMWGGKQKLSRDTPTLICTSILLTSDSLMTPEGLRVRSAGGHGGGCWTPPTISLYQTQIES